MERPRDEIRYEFRKTPLGGEIEYCIQPLLVFFFQAEDGIRDRDVTGVQTCALPILRLWDGSGLRPGLKSWLKREWEHVLFLRGQIAVLRAERRRALRQSEEPDLDKVHQLSLLRGIGENGSWIFVREFFGWRKFNNRREVGSLAGLTPTPYQSGRMMREQGIR